MNIKRIIKSRWFIGMICIFLAIGLMLWYTSAIKSSTQFVEIISVVKDIKKGDIIKEESIETKKVSSYNLSENFIKTKNDVIGKYANADLKAGDYILNSKISYESGQTINDKMKKLDGSRLSMSITLKTFASGVSDKLVTGDIVSCIITKENEAKIPSELTYVEVLATTTIEGYDKNQPNDTTDSNLETATLLVTPHQAELLAEYEKNADIHLALVYRGESDTSQKFLDMQNNKLKEIKNNVKVDNAERQ